MTDDSPSEQPLRKDSSYTISAPYGIDKLTAQKEDQKNEEAYKIKETHHRNLRSTSQSQAHKVEQRGAGISNVELKKKRDHETTLANEERRNEDYKARSIFDK